MARALLEPRPLEQSDHRQHEPHDGHVTTLDECMAELRNDIEGRLSTGDPGSQAGHGHHEQWVKPKREPDDDDQDADQREHPANVTHAHDVCKKRNV